MGADDGLVVRRSRKKRRIGDWATTLHFNVKEKRKTTHTHSQNHGAKRNKSKRKYLLNGTYE